MLAYDVAMKAGAPLLGHLLCRRIPRAKRAAQAVAMAGGYDGGMAAGRRVRRRGRRLRPHLWAVLRTMSVLLSKYWLQYVALKIPDAAEELFFALCEPNSRLQLLCHERNGAHEIGDLKEPVFVWSYVLREFPFVAVACRHGFVDEICDDSLAAIVIHFYLEVRNRRKTRDIEEFRNAGFEQRDNLFLGSHEFLVDADASVAERRFSGEGHHRGKYSIPHSPAHVFVAVFTSDKRPCMEAKVRKPHPGKGFVEFSDGFLDALLLIVGDERDNVEPRRIVGNWKIAGLVNEDAQSRIFVHDYKARAAGCPPLKAKNFLRVSVTPAFRPSSLHMISNLPSMRKGTGFARGALCDRQWQFYIANGKNVPIFTSEVENFRSGETDTAKWMTAKQ